jgi:myo-inositol 2-dehydrogenase / D-chiro-inositol 1-dehydrogenase
MSADQSVGTASRRDFLTYSAAAVAASTLATGGVHAAGNDTIKIGLIGAGGRGTGAAINALHADSNIKLTAMCDLFDDRLQLSRNSLLKAKGISEKVAVTPEMCFTGFDGYKKLLATDVDVVLLCTSPGFRPQHLRAALEAGKHVFCEKPVAVDATGVRSVLESAKLAAKHKLNVCSGFCYRFDTAKREIVKRVHDGAIGKPLTIHCTYNTGELWDRSKDHSNWGAMSAMEQQLRNWMYYTWLSGDHIVEQAIHNVDKARWMLKDEVPVSAVGLGGRQQRTDPKWGHIFDHFSIVYDFANGAKVFLSCRQMKNCWNQTFDHVIGTEGAAVLNADHLEGLSEHSITGSRPWAWPGEHDFGEMYQNEHNELFAAIRKGTVLNNIESAALSTQMAIMGRMAAYTGKKLTWKQVMESKENLMPEKLEMGYIATPAVAVPGVTKFV